MCWCFRMPAPVSVPGRSSSITNSFINGLIPSQYPSEEEVAEALGVLHLDPSDVRCAYCGDKSTELDLQLAPLLDHPKGAFIPPSSAVRSHPRPPTFRFISMSILES